MNIQEMMKQAQKLQKEMMQQKEEINNSTYVGMASFVKVEINGNKDLLKVLIDKKSIDEDEMEIFQDLIAVAFKEASKKVDADVENKLGKYTKGLPGLF